MQVSKEEVLRIANLADLKIEENEIEKYRENLQEILNFTNLVNKVPVEGLEVTVRTNVDENRFRKDEVETFEDPEALLKNAPEKEQNMFKIPKVIN